MNLSSIILIKNENKVIKMYNMPPKVRVPSKEQRLQKELDQMRTELEAFICESRRAGRGMAFGMHPAIAGMASQIADSMEDILAGKGPVAQYKRENKHEN